MPLALPFRFDQNATHTAESTAKPRYNVPRHNVLPDITSFFPMDPIFSQNRQIPRNSGRSIQVMKVGDVTTHGLAIVWTIEQLESMLVPISSSNYVCLYT